MRTYSTTCDIEECDHEDKLVSRRKLPVMFKYDQEDGKSKQSPYFEMNDIDICESCFKYITDNQIIVFAYGAMGHNKYYTKSESY